MVNGASDRPRILASRRDTLYSPRMHRSIQLDDPDHAAAIDREIAYIGDSGALGRSSKLRELFEYLVARSRGGNPPREVEIAQDVFGRTAQVSDDGSGRVYVHRLRRRLEDIYKERSDAELRIALPLGEYRLVAEIGDAEPRAPGATQAAAPRGKPWRLLLLGAFAGAALAMVAAALFLPRPIAGWREAGEARRSAIWAPLFANGRSVVVAEGDHYLFAERGVDGAPGRLVRDFDIHSREELDTFLLEHPDQAGRYADAGTAYVPTTVPRAQLYLSRILLAESNVRMLPASRVPDSAILSQNIVYLGLTSGLGPLRAPVGAGSRFTLDRNADLIRDTRTGRTYGDSGQHSGDATPRRQYGLVSLFPGKEGNRFIILAGTSEMGLVGLAETMADPARLAELAKAGSDPIEALYQVDSQGGGVLAVRLIATNRRDSRRIWAP